MKISLRRALPICGVALLALASCKKEETEPEVIIEDAKSLSANLSIQGAKRMSGDIPAPTGSSYGVTSFVVNTPQVIITPGNTFDFESEVESNWKVIYIKLDGTDEYFQITVDKDGNTVEKTQTARRDDREIKLKAQPVRMENLNVDATVQVFTPPVQSNAALPDFSKLNNIQYWSPPKRIKFKTFKTGTGDFFATLTWNRQADIDLWLVEPNGNKIYYANRTSTSGGELDYDNTYAYGPENIFFEKAVPPGRYEVWVHYFSGSGATNWTVSLKNGNSSTNYRGTLAQSGNKTLVATFTR